MTVDRVPAHQRNPGDDLGDAELLATRRVWERLYWRNPNSRLDGPHGWLWHEQGTSLNRLSPFLFFYQSGERYK